MVLQRDMPVPVWGSAAPGEKVTVKFRDQEKTAVADNDGKWLVKLDPLKAGGPDKLTVAAANTVTLDDVLVGEVWVGSGQSNMAGGVSGYVGKDPVLAKLSAGAPYPNLRFARAKGGWQEATPENVNGFSALLFGFGVRLHQELQVPVGLALGAVGGTPSGYWLSEEAYAADAACKEVVQKFAATYSFEAAQKKYEQNLAKWEKEAAEAKQAGKPTPRKPAAPVKAGKGQGKIGNLYEAHIRPFIPHAIRGVLWDQGESGTAITGMDQYTLMGALIRGWRKEWGQGDFPFLYVQKPSGGGCAWDPADPVTKQAVPFGPLPAAMPNTNDGTYVETHVRIMQYPNTAMVTSTDLGAGVHPINKSAYGERACRVALGMVYGRNVEIYGPVYQSHKVEGNKVRITFGHIGQGLTIRHAEKLQGFAIAGEDKVFHWADAAIDGDTVVVSSDPVAKPVALRYAWGRAHPWANLFNKDGLPALTFRTDSW
ncbi:MAG: sialate O-acetylesterase [Acidobacteria bacterium]|nr:sialate O-acetylesterase [Acidobacteriota bacterium]